MATTPRRSAAAKTSEQTEVPHGPTEGKGKPRSRKPAAAAAAPTKNKNKKTAARAAKPGGAAASTARVAQQAEQPPCKGKAAGSSPAPGSTRRAPDVDVFIAEYLIDRNGTRAAIAAGYSPKTARAQACRLLTTVYVKQHVEQQRAEVVAKVQAETGITLERTLREIARIGFFDPRRMFKPDGTPLAIHELDDDTAAVIAGLDVLESFEGTGADRIKVGDIKKWKLADKKGALDMLMKHLGGYSEDNRQKADPLMALLDGMRASAVPVVQSPADDDDGAAG